MDEDDKFWRVPDGHDWREAGDMLRRLGASTKPQGRPGRRPRPKRKRPYRPRYG
jgi:hypothetical protein